MERIEPNKEKPRKQKTKERGKKEIKAVEKPVEESTSGFKKEIKKEEKEKPGKKEGELKLLELELKLSEARKELAKRETKKIKTKEEKRKLEEARGKYKEIRKEYFFEKKVNEKDLYKEILKEQERLIEEKEKNLSSRKRFLYKLFDNKVVRAYLRIPREYRWVGYAALGSAALLGGGAGWAAAGSYFGLKLSRYIVGSFTSASAVKAVNAFEEYYGTKLNKTLEKKVNEILKKESLSTKLDTVLSETDRQLEKILKFKKKVNYAKAVAGIGGFLVGYGLTESIGKGVGELLTAKGEFFSRGVGVKETGVEKTFTINLPEAQDSYIETAQKGDSIWKMTKRILSRKLEVKWEELDEAQKTYLIDVIKDKISSNPEKFGLVSKDVNLIHPGEKINFSSVFEDKDFLEDIFKKTEHLSLKEKVHIISGIELDKKEILLGKTKVRLSSFEPIKENFGICFGDINDDGIPDRAYFISKNALVKEVVFEGHSNNLKEISSFINEARDYAQEIAGRYPKELFNHPSIFAEVLREGNEGLYEDLNSLAKELNDWKKAIWIYKTTGGYLGLLMDTEGRLDLSQFKILEGLTEHKIVAPEKIQELLSFSRQLKDDLTANEKLAWILLKENPEKFKSFIDIIDKNIDPTKIRDIHWEGDNLIMRIDRKLWFDKIVKLLIPIKK